MGTDREEMANVAFRQALETRIWYVLEGIDRAIREGQDCYREIEVM
jgi:hypothetical protein